VEMAGQYHQKDWKADVRVCGPWSVTVDLVDGTQVRAWGEFCELSFPNKLVMTRRFDAHHFLVSARRRSHTGSSRARTVRSSPLKTKGSSGAPRRLTEIWEKVLGWLDAHLSSR